jgi:hypothetical protein
MQQVTCSCGTVWNVEFERSIEKQPAWEFRCPDCDEHIAGLERDGFQKISVSPADLETVEQSVNLFFGEQSRRHSPNRRKDV